MDEQAVRNQAALSELKTINDMLTQRCVLLAAELAVKSMPPPPPQPAPE